MNTVSQSINLNPIKELLKQHGQEHLLSYADELSYEELLRLTKQIEEIDWSIFTEDEKKEAPDSIEPIHVPSDMKDNEEAHRTIGLNAIREGKLCLLLLAGGQGTRLGFDKPKGAFNMGITKDLFIFQLLMEHTMDVVRLAGNFIHMYIMTSDINYGDTITFFKEHDFFGYDPEFIHFFVQELNPATDFDGRILMNAKSSLALSPNGNGGWFSSMHRAGLLDEIFDSSLEWINVFAVDNVLQRIADPVFLGATIESGKMCGAKVVKKTAPNEKVGAICLQNGKPHIIEYYELSEDMMYKKNDNGDLAYGFGVTLNYLFPISRLKETLNMKMPHHIVKKAIPYIDETGKLIEPTEPNGLKYETLALDLIHEMDDCLVFPVEREKEFAPVKNSSGVDSVDTARELLVKNGYEL
ncbi:MAG: UDPGP type 1 family protein [Clostridium sp.]|nr:UDPGP type 1 family protein [Clostridium sp.]MCM1172358.1 UDPGP type 1 family protein [Clostridium sp.]MCM1209892.1 UDPGP type 1 family protein [Ruminococcus sp.]